MEAAVDTTLPPLQLVAAAIIFAVPYAVTAWLIVLLLRPSAPLGSTPELRQLLGLRPIRSWGWRTVVAGVLFAVGVEVLGLLWGPLISKYYHDPAYIAQVQTVTPPDYIAGPEELLRGVCPGAATSSGSDARSDLAGPAAYRGVYRANRCDARVVVGDAVDDQLPDWLSNWRGLDLTSDAIVRGVFVAAFLALPLTPRTTRNATSAR